MIFVVNVTLSHQQYFISDPTKDNYNRRPEPKIRPGRYLGLANFVWKSGGWKVSLGLRVDLNHFESITVGKDLSGS